MPIGGGQVQKFQEGGIGINIKPKIEGPCGGGVHTKCGLRESLKEGGGGKSPNIFRRDLSGDIIPVQWKWTMGVGMGMRLILNQYPPLPHGVGTTV